jgi:hypothetical protein
MRSVAAADSVTVRGEGVSGGEAEVGVLGAAAAAAAAAGALVVAAAEVAVAVAEAGRTCLGH